MVKGTTNFTVCENSSVISEWCKAERKYGWRASSLCFDWNRLRTCRRRVSFLPALFSARPPSELRHSFAASAPTAWALAFSLSFAAPAASGQSYLWLTEEDLELGWRGTVTPECTISLYLGGQQQAGVRQRESLRRLNEVMCIVA